MARIVAKILSAAKNQSVGGKKSVKLEIFSKLKWLSIAKKHFVVKEQDTKKTITETRPNSSWWLPETLIQHLVGGCNDGCCDVEDVTLCFGKR